MDAAQTQRERSKSSVRVEQLEKQCLCHCPAQRARHGRGHTRAQACPFLRDFPPQLRDSSSERNGPHGFHRKTCRQTPGCAVGCIPLSLGGVRSPTAHISRAYRKRSSNRSDRKDRDRNSIAESNFRHAQAKPRRRQGRSRSSDRGRRRRPHRLRSSRSRAWLCP